MKKLYLLGVFLLVAGLLFGGFYSRTDAAEKTPIKIGAVLALTGPASAAAYEEKLGALWAAEVINAAGGVKGRPLKIILEDDMRDPQKANYLTKKLITVDKVSAVMGATGLASTMSMLAVCNELKVPGMNLPGAVEAVFPKATVTDSQKFVFSTFAECRPQAIMAGCFMAEHLKAKKVGILQQSGVLYDNAAAGVNWTKLAWDKYGTELIREKFEISDVDFTGQLLRIKAFKPDAFFVPTYAGGVAPSIIIRQAKQILPGVPIVFLAQVPLRKFLELGDVAVDDIIFVGSRLAFIEKYQSPTEKKFLGVVEAHERDFFPSDFTIAGWDAVHLFAKAMESAGDNPGRIRDELEKIRNFKGMMGVYNFSPKDHLGIWMKKWSDIPLYTLTLKPYGVKDCMLFTPQIEYPPWAEVWETTWPYKQ